MHKARILRIPAARGRCVGKIQKFLSPPTISRLRIVREKEGAGDID